MHPPAISSLAVLLALTACGQSNDSFVGAESLPPTAELAGETIQINRDESVGKQRHYLTFELRPDNSLAVTHALDGYQGNQVVGAESLQLTAHKANAIREGLRRFRPVELRGVEHLVFPKGCEPPIDGGMEVAIAFFGDSEKIGIFALPHDCKDSYSARARTTFGELMGLLPPSKVAQAFPQPT